MIEHMNVQTGEAYFLVDEVKDELAVLRLDNERLGGDVIAWTRRTEEWIQQDDTDKAALRDAITELGEKEKEIERIDTARRDAEAESAKLRELLWIRHRCSTAALYGDDGEMQCGVCLIDFKRQSVSSIEQDFLARNHATLAEPQLPARASVDNLNTEATALLDAMETCHICQGVLSLDDIGPTHCENCSGDCDDHEAPECKPIYVLCRNLRSAIVKSQGREK